MAERFVFRRLVGRESGSLGSLIAFATLLAWTIIGFRIMRD